MCPEILQKQPYDGIQADLFAAGVILFVMKTALPPFSFAADAWYRTLQKRPKKFWAAHSKGKQKNFYSEELKDLLMHMLNKDPEQRLTIE